MQSHAAKSVRARGLKRAYTAIFQVWKSLLKVRSDLIAAVFFAPQRSGRDATCRLTHRNKTASLFDHIVGDGEHPWRHLDAERSRRLQVDDELEFGRLQHRQVRGLGALEDAAGIDADLMKRVREVGSIAHKPAGFDNITVRISRRNPLARRQDAKLPAAAGKE